MVGEHLVAARRLASDAVTAEVVSAMREHGIRAVLFKGPVIERWLYADGKRRQYGDIDLLVAPDQFDSAETVLAGIGFQMRVAPWRRFEFHEHEHPWARAGFEVDLHRGICGFDADGLAVWTALTSNVDQIEIGGTSVDIPVAAAQALMIAVHAVHHSGRGHPFEDLRRAVATADDSTWRDAAILARRTGALGPFTLGLSLLEPGAELLKRLSLEASANAGTYLRARGAAEGSMTVLRFAEERSIKDRLSLVVAKLTPSPGFLRYKYPIARRGRLGLLAAYAWRPLWLCLRAPAAWRAWRSAETAARRS